MSHSTPCLTAVGISAELGGRIALHPTDAKLKPGELLGLIGPNGAGKSTLLRLLAGLQHARSGQVMIGSNNIHKLSPKQRARQLGYLEQNANIHWPIHVENLVALGRMPHQPAWRSQTVEDQHCVEQALADTDMLELRHRAADSLSGGEQLRAKLARVLAGQAPIILADEPIAALDPCHQLQTMEILQQHCQQGGSAIAVLHDLNMASRFCNRLILLHEGKKIADGSVEEVLSDELLTRAYGIDAVITDTELQRVVIAKSRIQR